MRIEMEGNGSDSLYREVVNIVSQYKMLMKKPDAPLVDSFRQMKLCLVLCIALSVFLGLLTFLYGVDMIGVMALMLNAFLIIFAAYRLIRMNRFLNEVKSDKRVTTLILDEDGVAVEKEGAEVVSIRWDFVAFVRKFEESVGFFAKGGAGVIAVNRRYEEEIVKYLKENKPEVRVIS